MAAPPPAKTTATTPGKGGGAPTKTVKLDRWGLIPVNDLDIQRLIQHKHTEWRLNYITWRWLIDSYEGGTTYRDACYGVDRAGLPARNLFRHRREYPDPQRYPSTSLQGYPAGVMNSPSATDAEGMIGPWPGMTGADPATIEQDDPYESRRARTPVPEFVAEAVELHLSKLFGQEIGRDTGGDDDGNGGLPELDGWWSDVDGRGTTIDDWMRQTIAPLLAVLGCLDVIFDHPQAPPGELVSTRADELRLGLDRCVASYILPENLVWWRLDAAGRYRECLVREFVDPCDRIDHDKAGNPIDHEYGGDDKGKQQAAGDWRRQYVRWRLWRPDMSVLYDYDGEEIERRPHSFGRVPVVRLVDIPRHKTPHIGKSRYEAIAGYQRAYYNLHSEVLLNNTLQASPLLCVPEDYLKADNTISIGRDYAMPMKGDVDKVHYTAPVYIGPQSDPTNSLRQSQSDLVEMKDRRACLARPLAVRGGMGSKNSPSTDPQAAAAKELDQIEGHNLLQSLAQTFAKAERTMAEYALLVCRDGKANRADIDKIKVTYPSKFDLYAAGDLILNLTNLQKTLLAAGKLPMLEREVYRSIVRQLLQGLEDDDYDRLDAELEAFIEARSQLQEQYSEINDPGYRSADDDLAGDGSPEAGAETDPTGRSGATAVSPEFIAV